MSGPRTRSTRRWAKPQAASRRLTTSRRHGNWEGKTVLRRLAPLGSPEEEADLAASRAKLFAIREARARPGRDDKVLADWNGLTIAALARASAAFGEPEWLATSPARPSTSSWACSAARTGGSCTPGGTAAPARAACSTITRRWPARRSPSSRPAASRVISTPRARLAGEALDLFGDGQGGVYLTARDAADVPGARPRHAHDGATPSGVGLLMEIFARLWHLTDEARWREAAEGLVNAFSGAPEGLGGSPLLLMGADMLKRGGAIVIDGPLDDPAAQALAAVALQRARPVADRAAARPRLWPNGSPRDDLPRAAEPAAMLCQGQTCSLPVTTPEALAALIRERAGGGVKAGRPCPRHRWQRAKG